MRLRTELLQAAAGRARHLGNLTEGRLRALQPSQPVPNAQTLVDKVRSECSAAPSGGDGASTSAPATAW